MKKFFLLLLILIILVAGFGGYFGSIFWIKSWRASNAEVMGETFIKKVYTEYSVTGKNCQGEDSDMNSYVSCAFRIKNSEGAERTVRLDCPTIWKSYTGSTCRESISIPDLN
jgi:hypothetical protein